MRGFLEQRLVGVQQEAFGLIAYGLGFEGLGLTHMRFGLK